MGILFSNFQQNSEEMNNTITNKENNESNENKENNESNENKENKENNKEQPAGYLYNSRADAICKYNKNVTYEEVDEDFKKLFDTEDECKKFIETFNSYGAVMRIVRYG